MESMGAKLLKMQKKSTKVENTIKEQSNEKKQDFFDFKPNIKIEEK